MNQDAAGPAGPAGITDHELVALVEMQPTPQGRRALDALGLADLFTDAAAVRAGYATLLVRGLAVVEDETIVAQGLAASLGTMLTTADDILLLVLTKDAATFGRTLLVDAAVGGFLLDMTAFGVHAAQPLHLDTDLLGLVRDIVADMAGGAGPGTPFTVEVTRFPVDADARTAVVEIESPDAWRPGDAASTDHRTAWVEVRRVLGRSDSEAAANPRRAVEAE
jgi:hypothetical protein